jgi:hypothetical protein
VGKRRLSPAAVRGTVLAKLFGIIDELIGLDHRRIVLIFVIAIEPGQDELDRFVVGVLKLAARQGEEIDIVRECGGGRARDHSSREQTKQKLHGILRYR